MGSESQQAVREAGSLAAVRGQVVDENGAPLAGVTITITGGGLSRSLVTDANGRFQVSSLPPGNYAIRASLAGFAVIDRTVALKVGELEAVDLQLRTGSTPKPTPRPKLGPPGRRDPFTVVRVFYVTDRDKATADDRGAAYGYTYQERLDYGTSTVSIPRDHRLGHWEKPGIISFRTENQNKDVVLLSVTSQADRAFFEAVRKRVDRSASREALVFVHGYNTTLRSALVQTAILAYDLKFFGASIAFSWPSRGDVLDYSADEEAAGLASPHLQAVIRRIATQTGATTVHFVAHSMGNRLLTTALAGLRREPGGAPTNLGEVVLAAPDVPIAGFRQVIGDVLAAVKRVTLYASTRDKALLASERLHHMQRAGEGGQQS